MHAISKECVTKAKNKNYDKNSYANIDTIYPDISVILPVEIYCNIKK